MTIRRKTSAHRSVFAARPGRRAPTCLAGRVAAPLTLLILFLTCACLPVARGAERTGDAVYLEEFERHANAVAALETEFLASIEAASGEDRFYLYWTYNHLIDSWVQVENLQRQLELSVEAQSYLDEEASRTALRDEAEFVRWQLGDAVNDLQLNIPEVRRLNQLWINEALRSLLSEVGATVDRLRADQCTRTPCAVSR